MVVRSRRDTLRRHWRHQSAQCSAAHTSGYGFYSRFLGGLGLAGRASKLRAAALSALFAGTGLVGFATQATPAPETFTPSTASTDNSSLFEKAQMAYAVQDFANALSLAKSAGESGNVDAQVMAGHILMRGEAGMIDYNSAADWFRKAAAQGDTDAYMGLGEMALRSQAGLTPSDALHWFSLASQAKRPDAMRAIGEMYLKGQGIAPDPDKAADWLARAADFGDGLADRKMADSLFENDPKEALRYYEKAAAKGDSEAAYIAAIMYEENLEIRPNTKKMTALMRQAAESGHAAAQADYGLLVYQGRGVERNDTEAANWFEKSAKGGDKEGQFLYAFTLAKGEGIPQNFEEAYYWLLKSGESGISAYDNDRTALREKLEKNVDPTILARAKARIN